MGNYKGIGDIGDGDFFNLPSSSVASGVLTYALSSFFGGAHLPLEVSINRC